MRASALVAAVAALHLASAGCAAPEGPARDQWLVTLATDAPVPQLGDRLLVEVLDADGSVCPTCRHELGGASNRAWPVSFGVTPRADGRAERLRARLYRTSDTGPDGPRSDRDIDALVHLPPARGVTDVTVVLAMACFGVAADVEADASCDPATGELAAAPTAGASPSSSLPHVGSWPPAIAVRCAGAAPAGMVCVEGGAFLLGNPTYLPVGSGLASAPEQLVQLSPFFLDVAEVTIGDLRPYFASIGQPGTAAGCTNAPAGDDAAPANCVSRSYARAACGAMGKRLPTEAEWEWAAGNRTRETPYPWVDGVTDPCLDSVIGRGDPSLMEPHACLTSPEDPIGLVPGGNPSDVTALGILNLGGNVAEWTDDQFSDYADPACWGTKVTLHVNPRCTAGTHAVFRGGAWDFLPFLAHPYERDGSGDVPATDIGFRCAK